MLMGGLDSQFEDRRVVLDSQFEDRHVGLDSQFEDRLVGLDSQFGDIYVWFNHHANGWFRLTVLGQTCVVQSSC